MKLTHKTHDAITGEDTFIEVEETAEQINIREAFAAEDLKIKAEAEAKAQAKTVAEGKLAALGLTTDDLRALGL
jgi:hypothetical protein